MSGFSGTAALIRLNLRRDRVAIPIWIAVITLLGVGVGASFLSLYQTPAEIQAVITETAASPGTVAMLGPVYAPSVGALVAWRWTMQGIILLGLFNLFTVIRHTRSNEESGRSELVGSTVVGRSAPLAAALLVSLGADLLLALLVGALLTGLGFSAAGSFALGLSVACASGVVAAVAGITAQLSERAGAARGIAGAIFALLYLMRSLGDAGGTNGSLSWLSWLSPFGWARFTRPFAGERWWIFGLYILTVLLLVAIAFALAAKRDFSAGLLPQRYGRATAKPGLRSPLALAWRLQRASLLAWTGGFAAVGIVFGFIATTVNGILSASPQVMEFFNRLGGGARPGDIVFTLYFVAFGPVVAIYAISAVLRLRSDETNGLADPVLVAPVSRTRWMGSQLLVAALGQVSVLAALGLTSGLTYGLSIGDPGGEILRVLGASLAYLPAIWVMGGLAAALFGLLPRFTVASWAALALVAILELGWELQLISQAVYGISPFAHVPKLLIGEGLDGSFVVLFVVAVALAALGLVTFRRRDVSGA